MSAPTLPAVFHVGWVVRNCDAAVEDLRTRLGAGPFASMGGESRFDNTLVHGKPVPFALKVAFGALGGILLELLEPLDGNSPHAEFLASRGTVIELLERTQQAEALFGGVLGLVS